jgi:uncharacterized surface protein with fasciclin (FAS1) repeats
MLLIPPSLPTLPPTGWHPQVLQYHIIPSAALKAKQLRNGQQLTTALAGAAPLVVDLEDGKVDIYAGGNEDHSADVKVADIEAGKAIVHIIDDVLIPPSMRRGL